jgi:O-antigen/teichoic acid export membrane protein
MVSRPSGKSTVEGRDETELERWDRNWGDLMQEVRVAQTGVQILFAFLLTIPFATRFNETSTVDRGVYVATLLAAAAAAGLLIAPVSYHRQVFRRNRKAELVRTASRLAQIGLVCLLVAICGALFVVMDVVAGTVAATVAAVALAGFCGFLWYLLPLRHLLRR